MIEKEYITDFVKNIQPEIPEIQPSFFELTMMMAFSYFEEKDVDVAIIEVGLGGRLDSTNIIHPDLSVITNISFDHVQFLGDTLSKIAKEKAGIIKTNVPVIIGEADDPDVRNVFVEKAGETGTNIVFAEDHPIILKSEKDGDYLVFQTIDYPNLICGLTGSYQDKNANTVLTAIHILKELQYNIPAEAIYSGFKNVRSLTDLSGRWHTIKTNPRIICDTGHNEAGIRYIVNQLKSEKYTVLRIVFGMVNDKDISKVIALLPKNAVYYFTKASIPRALDEKELQKIAEKEDLNGKTYPTVKDAVTAAENDASADDLIFIGGSTFVVADALDFLQ
jgi:dihydrofolate synthase/folylpolyglutamate synthase